jgi:hypothetical protein
VIHRFTIGSVAAVLSVGLMAGPAAAAKPDLDPSYVNGQTVFMIGPHLVTDPSPGQLNAAEELYLAVYPINPSGQTDLGPLALPSGYSPQCDPCFHPGLPLPFAYHDHVLSGAPGLGTGGTADGFAAPWRIILVIYSPAIFLAPAFQPVTSVAQLDWGEAHGWFLPINPDPNAESAFEIDTGQVLICPLTSIHA